MLAPGLIALPLADWLVLAELGPGALHLLNPAAALIWRAWDAGQPAAQIADRLGETFGLPPEQAQNDTAAILAQLSEAGLGPARTGPPLAPEPAPAPLPDAALQPPATPAQTHGLAGLTFGLTCQVPWWEAYWQELLAGWPAGEAAPGPHYLIAEHQGELWLSRDGVLLEHDSFPPNLEGALFLDLTRQAYPQNQVLAVLHSAGVLRGDDLWLLLGESGRGKTTLTAHLAARGLGYYGDDLLAVLDPGGLVPPLPTALSLKTNSWPLLAAAYPALATAAEHHLHAKTFRLVSPPLPNPEPRQVANLLFPRYAPDEPPRLRALSPPERLEALLLARVWLGNLPLSPANLAAFLGWVERTPGQELVYPTLADADRLLERLA
ncbi:MAG: PqqD family protein [Deltaproteobacteria bacterium]|nr:PqqD family protein [Deltaproteobacteria bacterium]